jgi:hypothetical protein
MVPMDEGLGGFFNDPDLQRQMAEMFERMQGAQSLAWADNAIKLAVDMTVAAVNRINVQGTAEQQAQQIRSVMATVFPRPSPWCARRARGSRSGSLRSFLSASTPVSPLDERQTPSAGDGKWRRSVTVRNAAGVSKAPSRRAGVRWQRTSLARAPK